jgi:hypothetical protein
VSCTAVGDQGGRDPDGASPDGRTARGDPSTGFLGVNAQLLWRTDPSIDVRALARSGIRWVRADFAWAALEPQRGAYRWGAADRLMAAAASSGVQVLAIVGYSAPWASSDPDGGDTLYPPRSATEFARFAKDVAQRYGAAGTFWQEHPEVPALPLAAIEIWNEPWGDWNWKSGPDAGAYARLVRAVSDAVRRVQPDLRLLASGDLLTYEGATQGPWLATLLDVDPGLSDAIDGWSIHPYPDPPALRPWDTDSDPDHTFLGRLEQIRSILLVREARKPLWITEIGWCTGAPPCSPGGETEQRDNLVWALDHLHDLWPAEVAHVFVFTWEKRRLSSPDWAERFGLRREDGGFTASWYGMLRFTRAHRRPRTPQRAVAPGRRARPRRA